jgi:tetratricopeptide (TPR) repeat protein
MNFKLLQKAGFLCLGLYFLGASNAKAQNGFVGIGNASPKAKLDITSDTSGVLIPRFTTLALVNSDVLPKVNATDHNGLLVYVAEAANRGFWFFNGTVFEKIGNGTGGFFKVSATDATQLIYSDAANYGKNFLLNTDSVNYDGAGVDPKMMFVPSKSAFRVGAVNDNSWDKDSIGEYSFASGVLTKANKFASTAMGYQTNASGNTSTALGNITTASGENSTAMGFLTNASGQNSMALGYATKATNTQSTAMGTQSIASGYSATAMGDNTRAKSYGETAIGTYNDTLIAVNSGGFANDTNRIFTVGNGNSGANRQTAFVVQQNGNVGIGARKPSEKLEVNGNIKMVDGNQAVGKVLMSDANGKASWQKHNQGIFKVNPASPSNIVYDISTYKGKNFLVNTDSINYDGSGIDSKMMFIPSKSAFRVGAAGSDTWDSTNIGDYSFASGLRTQASGDYSVAFGNYSYATQGYTFAMGYSVSGTAGYCFVFGSASNASGNFSTAIGNSVSAAGGYSTAIGRYNSSSALFSTSIGESNSASGSYSTAIGESNRAIGEHSFTIGKGNYSPGKKSVAMGNFSYAIGDYSSSLGAYSEANGEASFAAGYANKANGDYSVAMGNGSEAAGASSIALGYQSKASTTSTAIGISATATGTYSTAIGYENLAEGIGSTAFGANSKALGPYSATLGRGTITKSYGETAIGFYNDTLTTSSSSLVNDSNRIFTVGCGYYYARRTAFLIQQDGNVGIGTHIAKSTLDVEGSLATGIQTQTGTSYTFTTRDYTVLDNSTTTSTVTYTFPDASKCPGRIVVVKKINAANHGLLFKSAGGRVETVASGTGYLTSSSASLLKFQFQSDGADWWLISN